MSNRQEKEEQSNNISIGFYPDDEKIKKLTVLQILKKINISINYECLDGYCGSCKCKYPLEGDVEYIEGKTPLVHIENDENGKPLHFLPCISRIKKPDTELELSKSRIVFNFDDNMLENVEKVKSRNKKRP